MDWSGSIRISRYESFPVSDKDLSIEEGNIPIPPGQPGTRANNHGQMSKTAVCLLILSGPTVFLLFILALLIWDVIKT